MRPKRNLKQVKNINFKTLKLSSPNEKENDLSQSLTHDDYFVEKY